MVALKIAVFCLLLAGMAAATTATAQPAANPIVVIDTNHGAVKVELYPDKAPLTVKNYLDYVDAKHYDGTVFHRVISTFMIQGGGMDETGKQRPTKAAVKNEAGNNLPNLRGTIAMARTGDPDSATAQFFINVTDNDFLNRAKARDGFGYTVFGRVIEGMDVVDKIKDVRTGPGDMPLEPVTIKSIRRAEKK